LWTSIITLADATKLAKTIQTFKRFILADCAVYLEKLYTVSQVKTFESLNLATLKQLQV
jgi:hypothetical protein